MQIRKPVVAGQFYPAEPETCRAEVQACLAERALPDELPERIVAGLVPHAGWTFSGALAALVFEAIHQGAEDVETFVVCGAAHGYLDATPAVDGCDAWETPLGTVEVDAELRERLVATEAVTVASAAHRREHSIEVQVPFIQHRFPQARILPIIVPPLDTALVLGEALAEVAGPGAVCIGSTDLTHYGPRYGFVPQGVGAEATRWAHTVNDRTFVDRALRVEPEVLLVETVNHGSACGPGAAAATLTLVRRRGILAGTLLAQTDSNEIMQRKMGTGSRDSVGYAALVF
jgi:MEMO1 family protein